VTTDGVDTELCARLHRTPRSRGLMGAPGGSEPRKGNSGDHDGRGGMASPSAHAHAHTASSSCPRAQSMVPVAPASGKPHCQLPAPVSG
jgi:hypothetical protein